MQIVPQSFTGAQASQENQEKPYVGVTDMLQSSRNMDEVLDLKHELKSEKRETKRQRWESEACAVRLGHTAGLGAYVPGSFDMPFFGPETPKSGP